MKTNQIFAAAIALVVIALAAQTKAAIVPEVIEENGVIQYVYTINTGSDANLWQVANITLPNYVNSGKNATVFTPEYYWNQVTAVYNPVKSLSSAEVKANSWANNGDYGWISLQDHKTVTTTTNSRGKVTTTTTTAQAGHQENGFYAYRLTFDAVGATVGVDAWTSFVCDIFSDDYVVGIFLNGYYLSSDQYQLASNWKEGTEANYTDMLNLALREYGNELVVIVNNNNTNGSNVLNATGLNGQFTITTTFEVTFNTPNITEEVVIDNTGETIVPTDVTTNNLTTTPEPATMAIFGLGLLGLGAARRFRSRK